MTKTIKLSLAAALLSTAAYAAPKVGGSLAHQYNVKSVKDNKGEDAEGIITKVSLKTTGAVNDNISYAVSYSARNKQEDDTFAKKDLGLSNAKFVVKTDMATVIAGRQGLTTPWTNGSNAIDSTDVGNGVVALIPAGSVTVVAAHVLNSNITNQNIDIIGALGKADVVNLEAWYSNIEDYLTGTTVAAKANIEGVSLDARYSTVSPSSKGGLSDYKTQSLMSLQAKAKVGAATINAGFAKAGKDGSMVSLNSAGDAANDIYCGTWTLALGGDDNADATLMGLGASMPLNDTFTAVVNYSSLTGSKDHTSKNTGTGTDNNDQTEIKAQVSAKVAKNLSLYVRHAIVNVDEPAGAAKADYSRSRIYVAYKF